MVPKIDPNRGKVTAHPNVDGTGSRQQHLPGLFGTKSLKNGQGSYRIGDEKKLESTELVVVFGGVEVEVALIYKSGNGSTSGLRLLHCLFS